MKDNIIHIRKNENLTSSPEIGDLKITYLVVKCHPITIVAEHNTESNSF